MQERFGGVASKQYYFISFNDLMHISIALTPKVGETMVRRA